MIDRWWKRGEVVRDRQRRQRHAGQKKVKADEIKRKKKATADTKRVVLPKK